MKNQFVISIVLISFLINLIFTFSVSSEEDHLITFTPDEVYPGDVFIIRLSDKIIPRLQFQGRELPIYSKDKNYLAMAYVNTDTKPGVQGITIKTGKGIIVKYITVLSKIFPVKYITLESDKVYLSPEDQKRADKEERILESLWKIITPDPLWTGNFVNPLDGTITSEFGIKRIINRKKESRHRGTDYKGSVGTPVKSINSGEIVLRDNHFYGGNTIVINHGLGLYSVYLHLSQFNVRIGDRVNKGQIIGLVGSTGRVNGPHLHLSVKLYGESINPESIYKLDM